MWEAPPSGGVEPSHESQDKYTTFYLQFQRFFNESHALADYSPNLKDGALSARLVKGLNNRLDGAWEFNKDLNIITGRNGSGKTTLLKLIWYSISGNLEQIILDIPFRSVSIETDRFSLSIIHLDSGVGKLK